MQRLRPSSRRELREGWGRMWMDYQMVDLTAFSFSLTDRGDLLGLRTTLDTSHT